MAADLQKIELREEALLLDQIKRTLIEFIDNLDFREVYQFLSVNDFLIDHNKMDMLLNEHLNFDADYQLEQNEGQE